MLAAVRRLAQKRVALGALCTGGYALAKAGLLDKYKAVIHWENMSALREEFPRVEFSDQLFAIDRDRYTCTGGVAPLDLMLHIIREQLGRDIVPLISEQFILDRIRNDQDRQHIPLQARVGLYHENLIEAAQATIVSAAARRECRGAHTVDDYADTPEHPNGRNDEQWLKHSLWHSASNSMSYKPVKLQPLTTDSIPPKVRTF